MKLFIKNVNIISIYKFETLLWCSPCSWASPVNAITWTSIKLWASARRFTGQKLCFTNIFSNLRKLGKLRSVCGSCLLLFENWRSTVLKHRSFFYKNDYCHRFPWLMGRSSRVWNSRVCGLRLHSSKVRSLGQQVHGEATDGFFDHHRKNHDYSFPS